MLYLLLLVRFLERAGILTIALGCLGLLISFGNEKVAYWTVGIGIIGGYCLIILGALLLFFLVYGKSIWGYIRRQLRPKCHSLASV